MSAPHENIRVNVSMALRGIIIEVIRERLRIESSKPLDLLLRFFDAPQDIGISILMPQEVYISHSRKDRVDAVFGGFMAFEYKSRVNEFEEAKDKAERHYLRYLKGVKYYVITNWDQWQIYEVERNGEVKLKLKYECERECALKLLKQIITSEVKEFKILPRPENIERLFSLDKEEMVRKLREVFKKVEKNPIVSPLFEAYKRIVEMLYGNVGEVSDLFIRHTLMHMIVLASLSEVLASRGNSVDMCSGVLIASNGIGLDVAIPYLNWWKLVYDKLDEESKVALEHLIDEIVSRVSLIDWKLGGEEDVFRQLYEVLIEPETRRRIGEYYTPLWVVDLILREFQLKGKLVLDPFCGSGTFLVRAFHRKVDEGEDPDEAYDEIVGLDVNPLAVAVARSELIIAYKRRKGHMPKSAPHVYHVDTLAMWFSGDPVMFKDPIFNRVVASISNELSAVLMRDKANIAKAPPRDVLNSLSKVEQVLSTAIREANLFKKRGESLEQHLKNSIARQLDKNKVVERVFINLAETNFARRLAELIESYGDSVWAHVVISIVAPALLEAFKPDIIVTNPPWVPMTEYKSNYVENIREQARKILVKTLGVDPGRAASVATGSDIASIALYKALQISREGVGFVMNREQSFYHRTSVPSGIVMTYAILKDAWKGRVILVDVDYNAFGHGIYPALIIAKREERSVELYRANVTGKAAKNATLDDVDIRLEPLGVTYEEYMTHGLLWVKESSDNIARKLGVEKVVPQGAYIRGLFGGEKKKGKEKSAGLVVEEYKIQGNKVLLKLSGLSKAYEATIDMMKRYGVDIFKLYYVGLVNPFKCGTYDVLLSFKGEENLREFLKAFMKFNSSTLSMDDKEKLQRLIKEVKQSIDLLEKNRYYVIYRGNRIFTACVAHGTHKATSESHIGYIVCSSDEQAYYYAAVLNYLAYKVMEYGRTFIRNQFARPLIAIIIAGLSWKNVNDEIKQKVVQLSKQLSSTLSYTPSYSNQAQALKNIAKNSLFREIVDLLDQYSKDKLENALKLVSEGN